MPEARDAIADIYDELVRVYEEFVADFADLEPPDEAQDAHDRAIDALNDAVEEFDAFTGRLRETDPEELERVFVENITALAAASDRSDQACVEIEELAAEHDVEIDLDCNEE
jgi:hypothetical protein